MANFDEAARRTLGHEGGYVDDPDDVGGETYRGVSRRYHPDWPGWPLIEEHKKSGGKLPPKLDKDENLQQHVDEFYKHKFWDKLRGDGIASQEIANELFDTGVNMGTGRAARFLQEGLNLLNRNGTSYDDISVDGDIGSKTNVAMDRLLMLGDEKTLLKLLNLLQGAHYIDFMRRAPVQEKFARGWLNRVEITRS